MIDPSHNIDPATVRGPFPPGESAIDYAVCRSCDKPLHEECGPTWETEEVMRHVDNTEHLCQRAITTPEVWRELVADELVGEPGFDVDLDLVDWGYIAFEYGITGPDHA